MLKLIKLFSWFKRHWKLLAGILTISITVFGGIQSCRANRWEAEAQRLDGKLTEQVADQDLLYAEGEKERGERAVAEAAEKQIRKDLEARIQKFQKDTVIGKQALRKEKEKTATMPPTEVVLQINERIGEELKLTQSGFLFSRLGTDRTLNRFKDGEFYLSEYNKFEGVIADHNAEVKSFKTSIGECEKARVDNLMGWMDCRVTLDTAINDIETLKKARKASVVWATMKGIGYGGIGMWVIDKIFGIF